MISVPQGSGNAGTTNALRVLGKKAGAITFLGDCAEMRGWLCCWCRRCLAPYHTGISVRCWRMYAGAGVVSGT